MGDCEGQGHKGDKNMEMNTNMPNSCPVHKIAVSVAQLL